MGSVLVVFGVFLAGGLALAADRQPLQYELYSWQKGPNWRFSVFEGTTTVRNLATIQARESVLRGQTYLKGRLAALQPQDTVYWRERPGRGLRLPSAEFVDEIKQFIETLQVNLVLPQDLLSAPAAPHKPRHRRKRSIHAVKTPLAPAVDKKSGSASLGGRIVIQGLPPRNNAGGPNMGSSDHTQGTTGTSGQ